MTGVSEADPLTAAADHMSDAVDEYLQAVKTAYKDASDGKYTADMWAKDMARLWACGVRGWARAATDMSLIAAGLAEPAGEKPAPPQKPPGRAKKTASPPKPPASPGGTR